MKNTVKYTTLNIQDVEGRIEGAAGSIKGEEWWGIIKLRKSLFASLFL